MAGGMGRSDQGRLVDRVAATAPSSDPMQMLSPARHCFVDGAPSLLVEWRQVPGGWEGRVISMVWVDGVGWSVLERWLPAALLSARASSLRRSR